MKWSPFIMPFSLMAHLVIINVFLHLLNPIFYSNILAIVGSNLAWILPALCLNFYVVERKERFRTKFNKFLRHYLLFCLAYFSVFSFLKLELIIEYQFFILIFLLLILTFYRWFFFSVRRLYRLEGGNYQNVVIVGSDKNMGIIRKVFDEPDFGYRYKGFFHNKSSNNKDYLGNIDSCYDFILDNNIDEIYCIVSQLSNKQLSELISFADNNFKHLKLIPDNKEIFTRSMNVELFGTVPVLNLRKSPLEKNYAKYGKRIFDILFSLLVIMLILSWLIPMVYVLMKMESRGPLFFKQLRHGYNKKPFWCYKFRSMAINNAANEKMCTKNDPRVTKLGKILRKTSIDELPQFINVLKGEMSVVGPRPHMETHTFEYAKTVDKYLVRHFTKPGITGLAQIKGYRGEISCKSDIINRTRFDIFYLEKWTPLMDFKIIFHTVFNAIKGEEKAF